MKTFLNGLSMASAFGGLGITLASFAVFCVLCARDGFSELIFSGWGTALVAGFIAGVVLSVAGVVGLIVLSSKR